eukprot:GFKZ01008710.1.p1 GENE.GFKZ01008710.1~~GFKZ01008710.1.p1  ORF type:complete len:734 (+),score=74.40 GFKZ01008710.1:359-2560(+)
MEPIEVIDVDEDEIVPIIPAAVPTRSSNEGEIVSASQARSDLEHDELTQPFVDIHQLFTLYNQKHFNSTLKRTYVEYSTRMTLCAGTCTFKGPHAGCRIALSEPLLKYRPRSDLLSTLLHEMIHAYLFETEGVAVRDGPDGHGPRFMSHANRINRAESGKVSITPYHSFTDEVDLYRVHHWTCNRCGRVIKRAMNRAPAPRDPFWPVHEKACGGTFIKTNEPDKKNKKTTRKRLPKNRAVAVDPSAASHSQHPTGVMRTLRIDTMLKRKSRQAPPPDTVPCPCCNTTILKKDLNSHLDSCLTPGLFSQGSDHLLSVPRFDQGSDGGNRHLPSSNITPEVLKTDKHETAVGKKVQKSPRPSQRLTTNHPWSAVLRRPRTESEALKEIVPNQEKLSAFAADPSGLHPSSVKDLIRPVSTSSTAQRLHTGTVDIVSILKDIKKRKYTPHELQGEAENRIRKHFAGGVECIDVSDDEPVGSESSTAGRMAKIMATKGRVGLHGGRTLDASEVLELIGVDSGTSQPSRSAQVENGRGEVAQSYSQRQRKGTRWDPESHRRFDGQRETRSENVGDNVIEVVDDVIDVDLEQKSTATCPVCDSPVAHEELERHVNDCLNAVSGAESKQREKGRDENPQSSGKCPVCDCTVPRSQLESHVNSCLNDADMANFLLTSERDATANATPAARPAKRKKSHELGSDDIENNNFRRCPLCDLAVPGDALQDHVSRCMLSCGLEDAF